jgi:hypothetical protein
MSLTFASCSLSRKLANLEVLSLSSNKITRLPPQLCACTSLAEILVDRNPLQVPPPFIVARGAQFMMQHLASILQSFECPLPTPEFVYCRDLPTSVTDALGVSSRASQTPSASPATTPRGSATGDAKAPPNATMSKSSALRLSQTEVPTGLASTSAISAGDGEAALLYFVSDPAFACSQNKRPYMEDRIAILPRCRQRVASTISGDIANLLTKVSLYGVFDG